MNKVFKVIWCHAVQRWVVVSELARGKRKNSISKLALGITLVSLIGMPGLATAKEVIGGSSVTASLGRFVDTEFVIKNGTEITLDTNVLADADNRGIYLYNDTAPIEAEIEGFKLVTKNSGLGVNGNLNSITGIEARGAGGVTLNITGKVDVDLNHVKGDTAIVASTSTANGVNGKGDVVINIAKNASVNVHNIGNKDNYERDGLELNGFDGNLQLNHEGSGKIEVSGGSAIFAKQRDKDGSINLRLTGNNIQLITHGDSGATSATIPADAAWFGHNGITAAIYNSNAKGNIEVTTNANILTDGKNSKGIYLHHNGIGENKLENLGVIETSNDNAHAIHVTSTNTANDGLLKIDNKNNLITTGTNASGIFVEHLGTGNVEINNSGAISTQKNSAEGIYISQKGSGNVTINQSNEIKTHALASHGIFVENTQAFKVGDLTINLDKANISVNDRSAVNANQITHNIYVKQENTQSGNVLVNIKDSNLIGESSEFGSTAVYLRSKSESANLSAILTNTNIKLDGQNADGIHVMHEGAKSTGDLLISTFGGEILLVNTETANTNGKLATNYGLIARNMALESTGNVKIVNNGTRLIIGRENDQGTDSAAIYAEQGSGNAKGNIEVFNTGAINTYAKGDGNIGIYTTNNGQGNVFVTNAGDIATKGSISSAIHVQQNNSTTNNKTTQVVNSGSLNVSGNYSRGIQIGTKIADTIKVFNTGAITASGLSGHGIYLASLGGDIYVESSNGKLSTSGNNSNGIHVNNKDTLADHTLFVNNSSDIETAGTKTGTNNISSAGIVLEQWGDGAIKLVNSGNILTKGIEARSIYVKAWDNAILDIENKGQLKTSNSTGLGAYSKGDVLVTNRNNITTANIATGVANQEVSAHGIEAISYNNNAVVQHLGGNIVVTNNTNNHSAQGIAAWGGSSTETTRSANVYVANNAGVDASKGNSGIFLRTVADGEIVIGNGSSIVGGKEAGVNFGIDLGGANNYRISNAGYIASTNDLAVKIVGSTSSSELALTNTGTIQGYLTTTNQTALNMDNYGTVLLRDQANSSKKVAVSLFNNGTINNAGTISLLAVTGLTNDATGEYLADGAVSSAEEGIQHAQLLGVKDFNHSGTLDLRGSGLSGNLLAISGGNTAGTNGNGNFTTNGGSLYVSTTLNEGAANSRSDMLVVDNIIKGSDSTKVFVTAVQDSIGGKTTGDGIQIIKTLGTQDKDAFTLGSAVTYGEYEYLLFGTNAQGDADGFYLRNFLKTDDTVTYLPNPNIGGYLGNQYAAANMFNQNILDRRDNVRAVDDTLWARVQYNRMSTEQLKGTQKLKVDTALVQVGADLYRDEQRGEVAGVFFGYGDSDVKNRSKITGTEVKGSVTGVQVGGYYSWMPQQDNKGAFVDVWGHYAHYSNELKGAAQQNDSKKYKGNGVALSVETGYGFEVARTDYNSWILEPHAQVTYKYLKMDSVTDRNETRFKNNKSSGLETRVGARFYGYKDNGNGVLPFVELNWLHNGVDNGVDVNGRHRDSQIGKNVGELKLGAKGNITQSASISAHIGIQQGSHQFRNSLGQLVFNYNF